MKTPNIILTCLLTLGLAAAAQAQSTVTLIASDLSYTGSGATPNLQTDTHYSNPDTWVELPATATGQSITFTTPGVAAGTYELQMEWKGNNTRGQLSASVDGGAALTPNPLDQYSSDQTYPTTTFSPNVTFSSDTTHTIKLTVTGKNASSSGYGLSAYSFILTPQGTEQQVATPAFSPVGGSYSSAQTVTISDSTSGATIRYTTDGSTPSETNGTVYATGISIPTTTTLKAIAYESGMTDSNIESAVYTIGGSGSTVTFDAANLSYTGSGATPNLQTDTHYSNPDTWVELPATAPGQSITYSIPSIAAGTYQIQMDWKGNGDRGQLSASVDGTTLTPDPLDQHSAAQSYPTTTFSPNLTFTTTSTHTIVLTVTGKNGSSSGYLLSTYSFTFTPQSGEQQVATPSFSPGGGDFSSAQSVTISDSTGGATIRYTTDGSTPSETNGTVYTSGNPVSISSTTTLKAIAYESGFSDSDVASATYTISSGSGKPNGNPILPPKWAFGVLFGSYHDQSGVENDITNLRNGVNGSGPFCGDMIWVDSSWLSTNYNGPASAYIDFTFDSVQFPDPASMISTLHANNFHFGTWQWPWMDPSNKDYASGNDLTPHKGFIETSSGGLAHPSGVWHGLSDSTAVQFDLSTTSTQDWWKGLNDSLFAMGFDFIKTDTTVGIPSGGVLANGSTSNEDWLGFYHGTAYSETTTANLSQGRGLVLAHSDAGAATNNDQYPGLWTGDSSADFSSLSGFDMAHAHGLDSANTAAYWCGDTGGYNGDYSGSDGDELYVRWLEYSSFTPLQEYFGSKGTKGSKGSSTEGGGGTGRFPWAFGTEGQTAFQTYSQLRYQLLPFRYSNALACYEITGGSVQWPVTWPSSSQILLGHGATEILVQPVTTAGATTASVTFPSGSNWIDYWTADGTATGSTTKPYSGGSTETVSATIQQVPLFIEAGSIIPMAPANAHYNSVADVPVNQLWLNIYPSGSTSYTFYEDDGISLAYQGSGFSTTKISSNNTSGKEVVTIGAASGSYSGQPSSRTYTLEIHGQSSAPASVTAGGTTLTKQSSLSALESASSGWFYDGSAVVWVKFSATTGASTTANLN